jgi:hypothetical protein
MKKLTNSKYALENEMKQYTSYTSTRCAINLSIGGCAGAIDDPPDTLAVVGKFTPGLKVAAPVIEPIEAIR